MAMTDVAERRKRGQDKAGGWGETVRTVVYAVLIALPVYIIVTLDNPYRGRISVGPEPMVLVYEQLMVANH